MQITNGIYFFLLFFRGVNLMHQFCASNFDNIIKITQFIMARDPFLNVIIRHFLSSYSSS